MKKKLLNSMKVLLVAVLLGVGASAWAVDITETYDFAAFITANGTGNLTTSGDGIAQSGTSAKAGTVKVIDNLTVNAQTLDLKGRFAVDYQYNAGSQIRFMWRSSSNNYQHGLAGQWNGNGTADAQGAARFSVLNLKAGDKIKFTYYKQSGKAADPYTCSASQLTGIAVDAALSSGTEYTVAADGNLDLYFTNNNFAIASIVIKTTGNETVTAPTFAITGAYNNTRKVTITSGTSDAGNDITTYYTTDGSTPTTSSPNSFTIASQEITVGEGSVSESTVTVKAISVSSTSTASTVGSQDVAVGTTIKLTQPIITLTGMGLDNEKYYKQYTFAAVSTGTYGTPTITLSATLGGNPISSPYTASTAGTISVTASADGYTTSDAATLDVDASAFLLSRRYDFTQDSYRVGLSVVGNNITITGAGVQVYQINDVNHISGITLSGTGIFGITKAQNSDTRKGLAPRWNKGSFTINTWIDGSFATLIDLVGNGIYSTSTDGKFSFGSQVNNNTFTTLNIYTPTGTSVSKSITASGWATYCSPYALDLANATGLTEAYIVTGGADGVLAKTSVKGGTVPANTGLLLQGDEGTASIPVVASSSTVVTANKLVGVTANTTIDAEAGYVLMNDATNGLGFYKNTNAFTVGANTAYLPADFDGSSARAFFSLFGGEGTGIAEIEKLINVENNDVYSLSGQRITQPMKGLYIVNGKKVVIK
ncbi:MAG: chitobiase/beta-hexosaminidase C-terminal domain-containing protein [Prevotella sp.]|nr:chitobiase/beta-hexosaminidase C-terminal domain-containing protein [Prevotella sp.]